MKTLLYSLSLLTIVFLSSCGNKTKDVVNNDSTSLRIALMPTMDNLPLYYAEEAGIFDSLGLDIKLLTYSSAMDCDTAFTNGEADGVISDIIKANIWRSRGDSVKVVMSTDLNMFLMTAHASRIKSIQSIKEKIIAVTRHSAIDYMADKVMEKAKLDLLQINKPQINNVAVRCTMTDQNQYDGAFLPEPYALEAESKGAHRIISSQDLIGNLSAVIFHDSIVSKRNEDIRKLVESYDIAVEKLNALVERGDISMLSYLHNDIVKDIPDSALVYPVFKKASLPLNRSVDSTAAWATRREQMKRTVLYKELVDSTFVVRK